jgi:hypothetical protein
MKVNLCLLGLKKAHYLTKHTKMVSMTEKKVYQIGMLKVQINIVPNYRLTATKEVALF